MAESSASDATVPSESGSVHTSIATSCAAPANTSAFISTVSVSDRPFCAARVPNAIVKMTMPGNSGAVRHAPSARPGSDQ
jgi:hypothetical protein